MGTEFKLRWIDIAMICLYSFAAGTVFGIIYALYNMGGN